MADVVEHLSRAPGGRKPLDPDGSESRRVPGVFLAGPDAQRLDTLMERVVERNQVSPAHARRMIMLAGMRAVTAALDAGDALRAEAARER